MGLSGWSGKKCKIIVFVSLPLLGGPKSVLGFGLKEEWNDPDAAFRLVSEFRVEGRRPAALRQAQ